MPNKSGVAEQVLSLPKGGGAIKGIGEKFQPDLHTGTGNFSIPIAVPPGRNGFQPQLTLTYSTGNGNGPFGLGWSPGIPGVTLKTSKGIPRYQGKDIYILSGTEDLILIKEETVGSGAQQEIHRHYRPRTEGLFARIIYVTGNGKNHWEVTSKSGIKSIYGRDNNSRVYDEDSPGHIFQWLLSETEDTNGNRIIYTYKGEDKTDLEGQWYEVNHTYNQVYLSKIQYVNYPSGTSQKFLFSVEFDYGEYGAAGNLTGAWAYRPDPFSTYRAGFEIRTIRRCHRILIKVHEEIGPAEGRLIKVYRLRYLDELSDQERVDKPLPLNRVSLLAEVTLTGYRMDNGQISEKSFPPLTFRYTRFEPEKCKYETFTAQGNYLPERALNQPEYEIVDLHGYGLPDVIHTSLTGFRYWRNLGNCRFDFPHPMHQVPAGVTLADDGVQFADMEGTGSADLLVTNSPLTGYYPTAFDAQWDPRSFVKYDRAPSFNLKDPDVKLVDMNGDGIIDVLQTGNPHFLIFYNRGKKGWDGEVQHTPRRQLEEFPDVYFSAPEQRARLAAMSGDMQDIILIHDRLIQYWPNMGYGKWGKRITMRNAPDLPRNYDPKRLFLTDIDGDGYADLVYVDFGKVHYWINQGGNAWSEEHVIYGTPTVSDVDAIRIADMKGTGTAGILWTYDYSVQNRTNYKYLDPTGGIKPYLLNEMDNHIGATTKVAYAPSTKFYLEDLSKNQPWLTHLPFPVQVVEKVEVIDHISKGKLVTRYAYHHSEWNGEEREFRGFGYVEQFDTETFADYHAPGLHENGNGFLTIPEKQFPPPTLTKTWFHVGKDIDYWNGSVNVEKLRFIPPAIEADPKAKREALRTLRGSILRTELYALDGSSLETKPYTVTENRYRVETITHNPAHNGDPDAPSYVFFPHLQETITHQFERGNEPRTNRVINLYDDFGNVTKEIKIGEPRTPGNPSDLLVLVTDTLYALNHPAMTYIKDRVSETLIRDPSSADRQLVQTYIQGGNEPNWKDIGRVGSKILGHTRNYYDGQACQGLGLGQLDERGNLVRTESLALTQDILSAAYPTPPAGTYPEPPDALRNLQALHYEQDKEGYWVETTRKKYDVQDSTASTIFGLVIGLQDPNGNEATVEFDSPYHLFPIKVTDAMQLSTRVEYDFQALAPRLQVDPNDNETEYAFDALGMLTAIAIKGKQVNGVWQGDTLDDPTVEYEYDLFSFKNDGKPMHFHSLQREEHKGTAFFDSWDYFDGFGRSVQKKIEAEPESLGDPSRWVGSGWQVYNNKGWVVDKYEPFFTNINEYESEIKHGVRIAMHYDPLGRAIRTINPDGSFPQVVYGSLADVTAPDALQPNSWETYFYDENDNGGFKYDSNGNKVARPAAEIGDLKIQDHLTTPRKEIYDAWGRLIEVHEDNGLANGVRQIYVTKHTYDLLGRLTKVTDAKGREAFRHVNDLLGNKLRMENFDAGVRVSVFEAAGNVVETGDSKGAKVLTTYDAIHRPLDVKARDDNTQSITLREKYTYDGSTGVTDPQALKNNSLGRAIRIYDGAGKVDFDAYDFKGNLLKKTRRTLKDTVAQATWPETTDADRDQHLDTGQELIVTTKYDALNRVTEIVYPDGSVVRPIYNNGNLLEKITVDGQEFVKNIDYNEKGQREKIEYGNGIATNYTYDPNSLRLKTLKTRKGSNDLLQNLEYSYDLVGNITRITDSTQTRLENGQPYIANAREYSYDPLYRLISATGNERKTINNFLPPDAPFTPTIDINQYQPYERQYEYDEVGNILSEKSVRTNNQWTNIHTHTPGTNRLERTSRGIPNQTETYRFDANGNMTGMMTNWNYFWDYADRMKGAENRPRGSSPTMGATYFYDSGGMRVKKLVRNGNVTKMTIYIDGLFEGYIKRRGNTVEERKYFKHVIDGTNRIAIIKTILVSTRPDNEPTILYQHGDHLGSSQVVTEDDGSFFNQEEYYPYGETSFGSFGRKRYRYTGKERDEESGLYYHGARYYAPSLGQWLSCDPAGIIDASNPYIYVRNNPIRNLDPTGEQSAEANTESLPPWLQKQITTGTADERFSQPPDSLAVKEWKPPPKVDPLAISQGQREIREKMELKRAAIPLRVRAQGLPPLSLFYSDYARSVDSPPSVLSLLPGFRTGWLAMDALFGETISEMRVDRSARLLEASLALVEDWMLLETAGATAGAVGTGAGILRREGLELFVLRNIAGFTGSPVTTPGGRLLTKHTAVESLAGRYALERGRRAGRLAEIDAIIEKGTSKMLPPQVKDYAGTKLSSGNRVMEYALGKAKVRTTVPTPHTPQRVITVIIPKGTPSLAP